VRLKWTSAIASRGRLAGQTVPLSESPPKSNQKLLYKIPLYQAPVLQKTSDHHILYFENELLPRFNLSNTVPHLDLKFLSDDPILFQSIIAVANAHHTYRGRSASEQSSLARIQDRNNALRMFRKSLMIADSDAINNSLFIANVLLCILDGIIEPISNSSATHHHLVGGKAILQHWGGVQGIFDNKEDLPILMLSIFATMDLTHALLIGDQPYFEASSWAEFGDCEPWWGNVKSNDDFLETMAILTQLATLGNRIKHLQDTPAIGTLLSIQMDLEQQTKEQSDGEEDADKLAWTAFCSVYRFTASVYLYRALSGLDVDHMLVQQAVSGCMEVIGGPNLTHKLHHCILFPVLVVGTHCMLPSQRDQIRKSIVQTATYLSFESLHSLESFLERRWVELDENSGCIQSSWWAYFDEIAAATCLF
jgi:hypothetical protein